MYEHFEHTADVGIRVRAGDLNELFADAARGLFAVMVDNPDEIRAIEDVGFELAADDLEQLLHDWLAELLYVFCTRRLVLADFTTYVTVDDESHACSLTATARGEPIDPARHRLDVEVKAITWHGLKIERLTPGRWLAEVIVDI
jgi:SHS2 domain-containing protein